MSRDKPAGERENQLRDVYIEPLPIRTLETLEREAAWERAKERSRQVDGLAKSGNADLQSLAFVGLAENVRDYAIFLLNPEGVITFWGEGARLMKWWTKVEAQGSHLRMLYPDGGSEDGTAEEHIVEAAERGEYTGEGHRVRSDCSTFWAGVTLTALRDESGQLLGFAKVTRDMTARRAADAALKSASEAAEQARLLAEDASRAKSLFLATISHELRTPLNSVMAYTDLLDMEIAGPLTDAQRGQLQRIRSSSMHLLGIVEEVLDFARLEAERVAVDESIGFVGNVVEDALTLVSPQADNRGILITNAVSGDAARLTYLGDEERVRQILVNLLSNAIKFSERGSRVTLSAGTAIDLPLEATAKGPGPWLYIRVEDTGHGIPANRIGPIFEPFVQGEMSLTRQHGGTGLGLAISRRLARLMGGDLTVRSEVGLGSTFFLWLPAAPEARAGMPKPPIETVGANSGLLIEIKAAILTDMERILHGYVARLRSDPLTIHAHLLEEGALEDHLVSFLSDIAQTLGTLDLAAGEASGMLADGQEIQRAIADRHGRQRFRLGWSEAEIRREFTILREELRAAIRRRVSRERAGSVEEGLEAVDAFLQRAESVSLLGYAVAARDAMLENENEPS